MPSKTSKLIVHLVGNAHLDPAWLWNWPSGVDEAMATCRTACDLLDLYPDLHVTRGEAWVYWQIQRLDPPLFKRLVAHVKRGRLHVVNGWWIQPDCNLPRPESFLKQSEIGGKFFKQTMGIDVKVGYNVDSFGHCAMLPSFLKRGGKDFYVFGRPGAHEMTLPSNLFRWQSPDKQEVLAFRVAGYGASSLFDLRKNVETEIALAPAGVGHTMCFYGIGDHGGGPTRDQIEWIQANKHFRDGIELRFSHPAAFFAAVKSKKASFPVVRGELNPHAVGCYTVVRDIKREVRRAEIMLQQVQSVAAKNPSLADKTLVGRLEEAWRTVLFNQFHDIMGGSSIQSVCAQALEELGAVKSFARDFLVQFTRKANGKLPPRLRQRIVLDNLDGTEWEGPVEFNPWFNPDGAPAHFALQDEQGESILFQKILPTYLSSGRNNILFPAQIAGHGRQTVEIRRLPSPPAPLASSLHSDGQSLSNDFISLTCGENGISSLVYKGRNLLGPHGIRICAFEDMSDTWSHHVLAYEGPLLETLSAAQPWTAIETGPLRAALHNVLRSQSGKVRWTVQLLEKGDSLRLRLSLNWWGANQIVKLLIPPGFRPTIRRDGTPGAIIERPMDKREYPVMDVLSVSERGASLTVISPDIYSADVLPDGTMRVTLLRCPPYALHEPAKTEFNGLYPVTDQGVHEYEIELIPDETFARDKALRIARRLNTPLWISETTKGMPSGWRYDNPPKWIPAGMAPVVPADAILPDELLQRAGAASARVEPAEKYCPDWSGEKLLVARRSSLQLNLSIPITAKYRLTLARLSGRGFGDMELLLQGRRLARLPAGPAKLAPALTVFPQIPLDAGNARLEINSAGKSRAALAFLQLSPIYRDIPADAWLLAGPFLYADGHSADPHAQVEQCIAQRDYPPEKSRNFDATYPLLDGSPASWQPAPGRGDFIDFHALTGQKAGSIHYAVTHIWSDAARTVRLSFGIDFFHRIWVNGTVVKPFGRGIGSPYKGQFELDVPLQAGWNELMLKVAAGSGGNGFWMAVSDSGELNFAARAT